ncbi:NAD-dependent epimerase/dehydratase family protein [SAR86 cluster bacterium]|nr:NAD-dependent epimerase/dehydratase family protein [SAR86 cluster bacterium]
MDKKSLLVVGGSGFIGSHLVERGLSLGWSVTSLGLREASLGKQENKNLIYLSADLNDKKAIENKIKERHFDYIINCGGYIDHRSFLEGGEQVFNTHFQGLLNLISCLETSKIKKFINIGSSDEYGSSLAPQKEDIREQPISPYSLAKVSSSHLLRFLNISDNFPSTTLRLFLVYGPNQDKKRFIPHTILGCLKNKSFPCSSGVQLRDFCYIEDIVDAIFSALSSSKVDGEILNIASGEASKIRDVIEEIHFLVGRGNPKFGEIPLRVGESLELYADISKAKELLNWQPKINLTQGLKLTIESYRNHYD